MPVVQARALARVCHLHRGGQRAAPLEREEIRRSGQHCVYAFAIIQLRQHQAVGVRVRLNCSDVSDDEMLSIPCEAGDFGLLPFLLWLWQTDVFHRLYLQAGESQQVREFVRRPRDFNVFLQPAQGDFHRLVAREVVEGGNIEG